MNSTIYVYGTLEDGFTQFPNDYASRLLKHGATLTDAPTAMVIHREGSLMYYSYIRRLETADGKQYVGFCVVLNGVWLPHVHTMMDTYERLVAELVKLGHIIRLDDAGNVVPATKNLAQRQQEVERIQTYIRRSLSPIENDQQILPPASYAVDDTHTVRLNTDATEQVIADAACQGGYVVVTKDKDYDDDRLTGYRAVVTRLSQERDALQQKNNDLMTSVRRTIRKEHRTRRWLIAIIVAAGVAWAFSKLIHHLEHTQDNLNSAVTTISGQRNRISDLNETIETLQAELNSTQNAYTQAKQELQQWKEELAKHIKIIVLDAEVANVTEDNYIISDYGLPIYARNVQYLKPRLTYIGINPEDEIHIYIRLYDPHGRVIRGYSSPEGFTYQQGVTVEEGEHTLPLMGWGIPPHEVIRGTYRFEFWVGHTCLKALDVRIY